MMEKYENLGLVGEGSYGMVMKCRNRESGRIVAIKKFLECEDDKTVRKIALREIKMLKQLRHVNLVNLLEVCKKKRRWYLVFEFVERTVLDELEQYPAGLDHTRVRKYLFQILRAITFCHQHNIIHRDIKPENILVSQSGVVKLCDFGFARTMAAPGEVYTDYVATRWYRAPELLVGDTKYGKAVDVWAVGCLFVEMLTGEPLFPGDSDIDQLYHIIRCFGNLTPQHQELFYKNPVFTGVSLPEPTEREPLEKRFPKLSSCETDLTKMCLQMDPDNRPPCSELQEHEFFTKDGFHVRFSPELTGKIQRDLKENPSVPKGSKSTKKERDEMTKKEREDSVSKRSNANLKLKECKSLKGAALESKGTAIESKPERDRIETTGTSKTQSDETDRTPEATAVPTRPAPVKDQITEQPPKTSITPSIPPITQNPLAIISNTLNVSMAMGPSPSSLSLRY
ncbi:cyclin-dependent kinase-like 2 [Chanos chanos]|uniref:Cyclin-dependent kinase-like 2 n=1 Tax=Chanos chanos TaxID=29144 RepID=A0A6J2VD94_CHACN|nr:cyclin-dependent kinase-like 2 [Chanos chanos]